MKYVRRIFLCLLVLAQSCHAVPVLGQCKKATPLNKNTPAPCSGIIMPVQWSLQAVECVNVSVPTLKAEKQHLLTRINACQKNKMELNSLCDAKIQQLVKISETNAGLVERRWWESPKVWGVGGFVLGGVIVYSVMYAVNKR